MKISFGIRALNGNKQKKERKDSDESEDTVCAGSVRSYSIEFSSDGEVFTELLLGGGVACNERLRGMCTMMSESRGGTSHVPIKPLCIDNGSMIATLGRLQLLWGNPTELSESAVRQDLRTDETPILWN